jgi:hypothetical protein
VLQNDPDSHRSVRVDGILVGIRKKLARAPGFRKPSDCSSALDAGESIWTPVHCRISPASFRWQQRSTRIERSAFLIDPARHQERVGTGPAFVTSEPGHFPVRDASEPHRRLAGFHIGSTRARPAQKDCLGLEAS